MIPTLILFGLVFGRWWRSALITGTVGWLVLLLATGVMPAGAGVLGALGPAIINTAVGVAVHQVLLQAVRRARH